MPRPLSDSLPQLGTLFPPRAPLTLRPPVDAAAWAPVERRFSGGYARRWFFAVDGQAGDEPAVRAHAFCSLDEALDAVKIADALRAEPGGYWVEPHWIPIAADGAGQHLMLDDRDGRVLAVAHDDDAVEVLAASAEGWVEQLLAGHAAGTIVWDATFGLIEAEQLARITEARAARTAHQAPAPIAPKHKVLLAAMLVVCVTASALFVWWAETHR